jgi:hypothetical protein
VSRRRTPPGQLPGAWTLLRDILTFAGGWWLIYQEVQRQDVRLGVLLFAGVAIGIPGLGVAFVSIVNAISQRQGGTPELPSSPPELPDSSPSRSP